jgi:hypothetical protein
MTNSGEDDIYRGDGTSSRRTFIFQNSGSGRAIDYHCKWHEVLDTDKTTT